MINSLMTAHRNDINKNYSNEKAFDDINLKHAVYNPHNLHGLLDARNKIKEKKEEAIEKPRRLEEKELIKEQKLIDPSFDSSIQTRKRKRQEQELAAWIYDSPMSKQFLFHFGKSIIELFEIRYEKKAQEKLGEAFKFYRSNQSGAVSLQDNVFLKSSKMEDDATLRVLGSSIAQTVAIGPNKVFLRMIKAIEKEIHSNPTAKQKYADLVDMDFFSRLVKICGYDEEGLPKIEVQRVELYKEGDDISIRTSIPLDRNPEYRKLCSVNDLKGLTQSELSYIKEEQKLPENIKEDEKNIFIATGGEVFRITSGTKYLKNAQEKNYPTTSGPSGTAFHITIAAKLLAPMLRRKLCLPESNPAVSKLGSSEKNKIFSDENYFSTLLLTTLMGYMHGQHSFDHHHSMIEVEQGCEYADQLISACYKDEPNPEAFGFGFRELANKGVFEEITAKSKSVYVHKNSVSIA